MSPSDSIDVLLVTRKFPPSTGGMEEFSAQMLAALQDRDDIDIDAVTYGGSNIWLPVVLPWLAVRTVWALLRDRPDILYVTDGLMSPLAAVCRRLFGVATAVTVYGLDITYENPVYQHLVVPTFPYHDRLLPISRAAEQAALEKGVPEELLTVVPGGVDTDEYYVPDADRGDAEAVLAERGVDIDLAGKTVLLSVGRLVERKGFQWFADRVMPELDEEFVYVVCGDGPQMEALQDAVERHGLEDRVFPLGEVTGRPLNVLYSTADALVMPNIRVEGDMEGFGLVAVEASSCGTPVVAADMEGMQDSVLDGNGVRVTPEDADAFIDGIKEALDMDRAAVRQFTGDEFSWARQAERYAAVFREETQHS
ncbi:MAG: glycosyltransferase family 4 protein [Candidatus Nanohaloarchaea archaeon]|nr:glycosyltransferase family 4 protein [Candidatus Nanohaloarchaea archaeon]